jgi:hypothetical protein
MSLMGMKYRFSVHFHREQTFLVKSKANPFSFELKCDIFENLKKCV